MMADWGFSALARAATASLTVVNVFFERKSHYRRPRAGCTTMLGFLVVAFTIYCMMRFA